MFEEKYIIHQDANDGTKRVSGTILINKHPDGIDDMFILHKILAYLIDKYSVVVDEKAIQNPYELFLMDGNNVSFTLPVSSNKQASSKKTILATIKISESDQKQEKAIKDFFRFVDSHEKELSKINSYAEELIEKVCNLSKSDKTKIRVKINKMLISNKKVYLDYFRDLNG